MKPLYRRLGLPKSRLHVKMQIQELNRLLGIMHKVKHTSCIKSNMVATSNLIALYFYYLFNLEQAREYATSMLDYSIEYFFGEWRKEIPIDNKPPDPVRRKKFEPWTSQFRESIFWASCLGDWKKAKKLAEYPTDECPVGRYETKLFCYWLLVVASVLRGESLKSLSKYTGKIDKSRRKYYTLLLNMLRAILDSESEKFNKLLIDYLDYCNEKTFNSPAITDKVSIDGTFLINLARHKGLDVKIPQEYIDRIVVLK